MCGDDCYIYHGEEKSSVVSCLVWLHISMEKKNSNGLGRVIFQDFIVRGLKWAACGWKRRRASFCVG